MENLSTVTLCAALPLLLLGLRTYLKPKPLPGIPHLAQDENGNPVSPSLLGDWSAFAKSIRENGGFTTYFVEPNARKYGAIYQLLLGPFMKMVVVSDAQEIEDLLTRRGDSLRANDIMTAVFGGVFPTFQLALESTVRGSTWEKHRRIGGAAMSPEHLSKMTYRVEQHTHELVAYWKRKMQITSQRGGVAFEAEEDVKIFTGDVLSSIGFGETLRGLETGLDSLVDAPWPGIDSSGGAIFSKDQTARPPLHSAVRTLWDSLGDAINYPPGLLPFYWFWKRNSGPWASSRKLLRETIQRNIVARRKVYETNNGASVADCILDVIIERQVSGGEALSDEELIDELSGYIYAGQDTTALTITWGLKFLTNHPDVQIKLRQELLSQIPNARDARSLAYEDLNSNKTPYLEAVIAEILRCAKVAGSVMRATTEDTLILGRHIPKDTIILMLTGFAGLSTTQRMQAQFKAQGLDENLRSEASRDSKVSWGVWDDDDVGNFNPERWLADAGDASQSESGGTLAEKVFVGNRGCSMPFGLGHRSCFGSKLAMLQLKMVIATVNLSIFLGKVPDELNSFECTEVLARQTRQSFIAPSEWRGEHMGIDVVV